MRIVPAEFCQWPTLPDASHINSSRRSVVELRGNPGKPATPIRSAMEFRLI